MSVRTLISAIGALALLGAASAAQAQTAQKEKPFDFTVRSETSALAPKDARSLKWDANAGRWGLTLNLQQPSGRDVQANDIQAGAYFRVTPQLRVGGAVALGEKEQPEYRRTQPVEGAPRVRLETAFKF